jgi:F-type H+-transporting ATPase subunit a
MLCHDPPENFQKSACEIFHDEAISFFSNPQLVWLIEQSVSSEVVFIVKSFSKIFLVFVFFATIFLANADAQPSTQTDVGESPTVSHPADSTAAALAEPASGAAESEKKEPSGSPPVLFYIGLSPDKNVPSIFAGWWPEQIALPVSNSIVCSWIVAAIILVVVRVTTWKNIKEVPSGMQNLMEMICESWESFMTDVLDARVTRWVFPFATTFLIFIVLCNYVDLIPGVGSIGYGTPVKNSMLPFAVENVHVPFFRPPTSDANLTVAMTVVFLVMSLFWAVRYNGVGGFFKHVFGVKMQVNKWMFPLVSLLFLFIGLMEAISILFARPVALAMRLYGNVFAGETMLHMGSQIANWLGSLAITLVVYFYETFICGVQGFVFGLLVVAFVGTMCSHEEESGH